MVHTSSPKRIHNLAPRRLPAVLTIFFFFWTAVCAQSSRLTDDTKPRPFNLLVLGDSILWGQGLKEEHKAWYLVKNWLQQTTGRDVRGRRRSRSGRWLYQRSRFASHSQRGEYFSKHTGVRACEMRISSRRTANENCFVFFECARDRDRLLSNNFRQNTERSFYASAGKEILCTGSRSTTAERQAVASTVDQHFGRMVSLLE